MAITVEMSPYTLLLVEMGVTITVALITLVLYYVLRSRVKAGAGDATEVYIGGEHPSILSSPAASSAGMYSGFIRSYAKKLYYYVREVMHSGRLSEWFGYMAVWFGFLLVIALLTATIMVVVGGTW